MEKVKAPRSYWEMETGLQIRVRLMKIIRNDRIKNVGKSETCTVFQITDYLQTHPYNGTRVYIVVCVRDERVSEAVCCVLVSAVWLLQFVSAT